MMPTLVQAGDHKGEQLKMKLQFDWQKPILLTKNKQLIVREDDFENIDNVPGVYYFARNFGANSAPFYIGETLTLRSRLTTHLRTVRIVDILRGMPVADAPTISNGPRSFHYAYLAGNPGKEGAKKRLSIAQRFMIRTAIA